MLEYARFQSSRLNADLGRESSGFFALGSSLGTRSSSSSSFSSTFFCFFSALGAGGGAGFFSFSSFFGGTNCAAFSHHSMGPKMAFSAGWFTIVSAWRTVLGSLALSAGSMIVDAARWTTEARVMSARVTRSVTR